MSTDIVENRRSLFYRRVPAFETHGLCVLSVTISIIVFAKMQTILFTQHTHNRASSSTIDGYDDLDYLATYIGSPPRLHIDINLSCDGCRASRRQLASSTLILGVRLHRFRRSMWMA